MIDLDLPECDHCGYPHIRQTACEYNLHGEDDPFKTSCAACGEEIDIGQSRSGDRFGNIYCDDDCKERGLEMIYEKRGDLP